MDSQNAPQPKSPTGQIEGICNRFEAAWRTGRWPRIEDYLPVDPTAEGSPALFDLLAALVTIDLEYRWRPASTAPAASGQQAADVLPPLPDRPRLEDYVARYPALGPPDRLPLELIVEEYRVRHRWGDRPGHDEYLARFGPRRPGLSEMLARTDGELAAGETIGQPNLADQPWAIEGETPSRRIARLRQLGDYELLEKLGHGGMGVVYKARQVLLNQVVALKVLPEKYLDEPQAVSRFRREMQLIGGLNHPNIVQAHNAGEQQGVHYLVMEFVDGITLEQLVCCQAALSVGAACEMIRQAALGLQHAHMHGLVHRDVKPANLMLSSSGAVKILDLGLARLRADQQTAWQLSQPGVSEPGIAIGTVDYMAPEQWEDSSGVDIRADIYSLGCTLFYLLTGKAPYGEPSYETLHKKLAAHATAPVPSIFQHRSDCAEELDGVLSRMLAKEVDDRFATPAEVADAVGKFADLEELVELLPAGAAAGEQSEIGSDAGPGGSDVETWKKRSRPSSRALPPKPWYRRLGVVMTVLLGVVVLAGVTLGLASWLASRARGQLRADLGTLPGLKGGWWFDETPWFVPAVRAELIEAIDRGENQIAGISLQSLAARARDSNVDVLYRELERISQQLKQRIPDENERKFVAHVQVLLGNRDKISPQSYRELLNETKDTLDTMRTVGTPTAQHFRAVIQHELARYNLAEWSEARASYEAALEKYKEREKEHAKILRALCMADYSQMLFDAREYKDSVSYFQEARRNFKAPALVTAALCQEADASRRLRPIPNVTHALKCLQEAEDTGGLPEDHPLRAHIIERRAWVQMDCWQFSRAIESFRRGLAIRAQHEQADAADATIFALWNRQGVAMAHHFLGEKEKVIEEFEGLRRDIPDAFRTAEHKERRRSERGPNVYECYADWYLFGTEPDYRRAAELLHEGIQQAEFLHFPDDYRAPYVLRLHHKHQLARALVPTSADEPPQNESEEHPPARPDDQPKDSQIFAEARDVADAVAKLQAAIRQGDKTGVDPLFRKIQDATPGTHLARNKIGFLLLAIEQACDSKMLAPGQLKVVARQLVEIARETSLGKDPGVARFLRRYLEAVDRELTRVRQTSATVDLAREQEMVQEWLQRAPGER